MDSILHLNLYREFFAAIVAKEKFVEKRALTPYWRKRLEGRHYKFVKFRNGYAPDVPEMLVQFRGVRRYGKGQKGYYAIRLGRILELRRWPPRQRKRR